MMENGRDLERYCASLHAGTREKERAIAPWIPGHRNGEIVDVGMGTGSLALQLAVKLPRLRVVAVDACPEMLRVARGTTPRPSNLEFRSGFAEQPQTSRAAAVVFCSVLHEVYSYNGGSLLSVANALKAAYESLVPGGRVIVRDFVRPLDDRRKVILRHWIEDIRQGHDFCAFWRRFWGPVALDGIWGDLSAMRYSTDLGSAYEFIARKDFHRFWCRELRERYGFWDRGEAETLVLDAGFRILHAELMRSEWVERRSLAGKIQLLDAETRAPVAFPTRHLLLVAEKPHER